MRKLILLFALLSQVAIGQHRGLVRVSSSNTVPVIPTPTTPTTSTTAVTPTPTTPVTTTAVAATPNTPASLTITFTGSPSNPTFTFADLKYNKLNASVNTTDDGKRNEYEIVYPVIWGGTGPDGIVYPGYSYDDGTGKQVKWHWTFALNWNNGQITNAVSSQKHKEMIDVGFSDVANHSFTHAGYYDKYYDLHQNELSIYQYLGYKTRNLIIPTDFAGFVELAFKQKYIITSSQGYGGGGLSSDGNNTGSYYGNILWGERVSASKARTARLITTRLNAGDNLTNSDFTTFKTWLPAHLGSGANADSKYMVQWFSHGPGNWTATDTNSFNNFKRMADFMQTTANGNIWFSGLQEFGEYIECVKNVGKTQTVQGATMVINLDYSAVSPNARWQDLTLLLAGGTIQSIKSSGADDVTFNAGTGQINIYKKKTTGFSDPAADPVPPVLTTVKVNPANANQLLLGYDRAVTQSIVAAYTLHTGSKTGTAIVPTSLTGSGANWVLTSPTAFTAGQAIFLDYVYDVNPAISGNVVDSNNLLGTPYYGFAVTNSL